MKSKQQGIGRLYGIGVGPGDPELLTLRAARILSRVAVIFTPQKDEQSQSYAGRIIAGIVKEPQQRVIELVFPMRKNDRGLVAYWQKAADTIWHYLSSGDDGAFITEGDPLLYGTFIYVFDVLRKDHPELKVEVIPGISSINAAAARALVPLASGSERLAILAATDGDETITEALQTFDTVVLLKINAGFERLLAILEKLDLVDRCVYVRRCTTEDEEIVRDISQLKGRKLDYLSLLIVRR